MMLGNLFGADLPIVIVIALVVLVGGSQLPKIARNVGSAGREFRKAQEEAAADDARDSVVKTATGPAELAQQVPGAPGQPVPQYQQPYQGPTQQYDPRYPQPQQVPPSPQGFPQPQYQPQYQPQSAPFQAQPAPQTQQAPQPQQYEAAPAYQPQPGYSPQQSQPLGGAPQYQPVPQVAQPAETPAAAQAPVDDKITISRSELEALLDERLKGQGHPGN